MNETENNEIELAEKTRDYELQTYEAAAQYLVSSIDVLADFAGPNPYLTVNSRHDDADQPDHPHGDTADGSVYRHAGTSITVRIPGQTAMRSRTGANADESLSVGIEYIERTDEKPEYLQSVSLFRDRRLGERFIVRGGQNATAKHDFVRMANGFKDRVAVALADDPDLLQKISAQKPVSLPEKAAKAPKSMLSRALGKLSLR